jgi:N-acetyl-anhydromuramyl-L-alanine amidase AmpD
MIEFIKLLLKVLSALFEKAQTPQTTVVPEPSREEKHDVTSVVVAPTPSIEVPSAQAPTVAPAAPVVAPVIPLPIAVTPPAPEGTKAATQVEKDALIAEVKAATERIKARVAAREAASQVTSEAELQKKLQALKDARHAEGDRSSPKPIPAAKQVVGDIAHKMITTLSINQAHTPELWIPFAERLGAPYAAATQGFYPRGYPQGMIQHYAGSRFHTRQDALNVLEDAASSLKNYSYLLIDGLGNLYQTAPLNRWGWHSGKSVWPGLGQFVHQWLVGLEVSNAGLLVEHNGKFYAEWGEEIPANEVHYVPTRTGNMTPGHYHKFSDAQIAMVDKTVHWLKENGGGIFKYELCLGHDEVSPGRKQDPGGSLPYTMKEYRLRLMDGRSLK